MRCSDDVIPPLSLGEQRLGASHLRCCKHNLLTTGPCSCRAASPQGAERGGGGRRGIGREGGKGEKGTSSAAHCFAFVFSKIWRWMMSPQTPWPSARGLCGPEEKRSASVPALAAQAKAGRMWGNTEPTFLSSVSLPLGPFTEIIPSTRGANIYRLFVGAGPAPSILHS